MSAQIKKYIMNTIIEFYLISPKNAFLIIPYRRVIHFIEVIYFIYLKVPVSIHIHEHRLPLNLVPSVKFSKKKTA